MRFLSINNYLQQYMKNIIATLLIFLLFTSCTDNIADNVMSVHMNDVSRKIENESISKFHPIWDEGKSILLPEKVIYAIKNSANVSTKNEPEVTQVIPTLGYFNIDGEEYRWLITDEVLSDKLSKQRKSIKLPKSLSLHEVMSLQNWHELWRITENFENAKKQEKEDMTSCLIDAFNKLNK